MNRYAALPGAVILAIAATMMLACAPIAHAQSGPSLRLSQGGPDASGQGKAGEPLTEEEKAKRAKEKDQKSDEKGHDAQSTSPQGGGEPGGGRDSGGGGKAGEKHDKKKDADRAKKPGDEKPGTDASTKKSLDKKNAGPGKDKPGGKPVGQFGDKTWSGDKGGKPDGKPGGKKIRDTRRIDDIKKDRRKRVELGGKRTVIEEPDKRIIIKEHGRTTIRHDETERFRRTSHDVRSERRADGSNIIIALRPGGIEIFSEFDTGGRLMRRYRRGHDGREVVLIDNRRYYERHRSGPLFGAIIELPPPLIRIPRERYIVDYDRASEDEVYEALMAPPVDDLPERYSLEEIRQSHFLRDRMRRVDLDTVNFEFGSWEVDPDQYSKLERVARAINRILDRHPDEVFMVEGFTDAVGDEIDNLTLSDRRAESVAEILSETFDVPPENLVTQGYGEQFPKVPTEGPERLNRRVAVQRITPLMAR